MSRKAEQIFRDALTLAKSERASLANMLIRSLEEPTNDSLADESVTDESSTERSSSSAWDAEIRKRIARLEAVATDTVSWPELRERLLDIVSGRSPSST